MITHKRARANARCEKALACKPVVSDRDCRARDLQRAREIAARRQTVAGTQTPVSNRATYLPIDLSAQILAADEVDVKFHWRGEFTLTNWLGQKSGNWILHQSSFSDKVRRQWTATANARRCWCSPEALSRAPSTSPTRVCTGPSKSVRRRRGYFSLSREECWAQQAFAGAWRRRRSVCSSTTSSLRRCLSSITSPRVSGRRCTSIRFAAGPFTVCVSTSS